MATLRYWTDKQRESVRECLESQGHIPLPYLPPSSYLHETVDVPSIDKSDKRHKDCPVWLALLLYKQLGDSPHEQAMKAEYRQAIRALLHERTVAKPDYAHDRFRGRVRQCERFGHIWHDMFHDGRDLSCRCARCGEWES